MDYLQKITDIIDTYESGCFKDLHVMQRELSCAMYKVTLLQIQANRDWNEVYHNSNHKTSAAKTKEADKEVEELYLYRKVLEAAKNVQISISQELKLN